MLELYQAEWCPFSHQVRLRLTELGLDVQLHQVPADPGARDALVQRTGERSIPTLVAGAEVVSGSDEILEWLERRYSEPPGAELHRRKLRADWPLWLRLHGGG